MPFEKGRTKTGGRAKGTKNKQKDLRLLLIHYLKNNPIEANAVINNLSSLVT